MRWTAMAGLLLVLVGCGPEGPAGSAGEDAGDGALEGTEWVLVDGSPTVEGYPITLRVEGGEISGTAACNSYSGTVDVTPDTIAVGDLAQTEMACPDPGVHDSESAYLEALRAVERYERTGGELVLFGAGNELRFEEAAPVEDAELTGTDWQLEALVSGMGPDGTASSTMADATLRLDDDGSFSASDGCNDLGGRWAIEGEVLELSDVATTDVACPPLEQQVEHVNEVLLGAPTLALEGRRLTLTAGDRALDYRAP